MDKSTYHVTCVCGHEVVSHEPETVCPHCGRGIKMEWQAELPKKDKSDGV